MIKILKVTNHHQFDGITLHSDKQLKVFLEALYYSRFTFTLTIQRGSNIIVINSLWNEDYKRVFDFVDGVTLSL
jgi:hypothetical protein